MHTHVGMIVELGMWSCTMLAWGLNVADAQTHSYKAVKPMHLAKTGQQLLNTYTPTENFKTRNEQTEKPNPTTTNKVCSCVPCLSKIYITHNRHHFF